MEAYVKIRYTKGFKHFSMMFCHKFSINIWSVSPAAAIILNFISSKLNTSAYSS